MLTATVNDCYIYGKNKLSTDIEVKADKVIFPLASDLVLYMIPNKNVRHDLRNRLLPMSDVHLKEIQQSIASTAKRWLYSYSPLTEKEINLIRKARNRRS